MGNDIGRGVTGIGKDTRSAKQFTPALPPDATQLSEAMRTAIEQGLAQDNRFQAEDQQAFREDRPVVKRYLEEDRTLRDQQLAKENQYTTEDRANRDATVAMLTKMLGMGSGADGAQPMKSGDPAVQQIYDRIAKGEVDLEGLPSQERQLVDRDRATGSQAGVSATKLPAETQTRVSPLDTLLSQIDESLKTGGVGAQVPIINRAVESSRLATSNALQQLDDRFGSSRIAGTPYAERTRADQLMKGELATANIPTDFAKIMMDIGSRILPGVEASRANEATQQRGQTVQAMETERGQDIQAKSIENSRISDIIRAIVGLRSGVAVAPSTNQVLGFGASQSPSSTFLNLGPTGASILGSDTSRANTGANVASARDIAEWKNITDIYVAAIGAACWVAFAIYGPTHEFMAARHFIVNVWQGRLARATRAVYVRYGQRIARSRVLCRALKPLFDIAVRKGEQAWAR